jgi:uncharacterized delta-60 repeat protein
MRNILTLGLLAIFSLAKAQDGTLDPSFGTGGKVSTTVSGDVTNDPHKIIVLSDGSIYQCYTVVGAGKDFGLAHYLADGSLDPAFGAGGTVTTDFGPNNNDYARSMTVQVDGKIIVAGYSDNGANSVFAVARYNTNGSLDNTFDGDGKLTTLIGTDARATAVLESGGSIVVAGASLSSTTPFNYLFTLVRYTSTGALDNSFDGDGIVTTNFGGMIDFANSLVMQTDGKLVAAGYSTINGGANTIFALARYNTNGSLDNTFDGDGKLTTAFNGFDIANAVTIQGTKIIAAGSTSTGTNNTSDFAIVRYNANGSLDNTFDGDGKLTTAVGTADDVIYSLFVQSSDNKIVVLGSSEDNTGTDINDFAVARYTNTGVLDPTFGINNSGINTVDFGGNDLGFSAAPSGNFIMLGGITGTSLGLARLINSSAVLPVRLTSFNAIKQTSSVVLQWHATGQETLSSFEVQRSANGINFTAIGTVANNNKPAGDYSFNDNQPLLPINYYRLKITELDGHVIYSAILAVRFNASLALQVFPNPVRTTLNVQVTVPSGKLSLQLLDVSGRVLKAFELRPNGNTLSTTIDMSGLQSGTYFLRAGDETVKVLKE